MEFLRWLLNQWWVCLIGCLIFFFFVYKAAGQRPASQYIKEEEELPGQPKSKAGHCPKDNP